jgi:hypothetical protein
MILGRFRRRMRAWRERTVHAADVREEMALHHEFRARKLQQERLPATEARFAANAGSATPLLLEIRFRTYGGGRCGNV